MIHTHGGKGSPLLFPLLSNRMIHMHGGKGNQGLTEPGFVGMIHVQGESSEGSMASGSLGGSTNDEVPTAQRGAVRGTAEHRTSAKRVSALCDRAVEVSGRSGVVLTPGTGPASDVPTLPAPGVLSGRDLMII
jgi:hypothetical protein